ncbi:MAG TPA: tRNA-dependent cyclodipeptide synthase [Patescibacteria group bacterium]|nr:tRNA-dependent cyclodipeptide synthase [Patescibacteria group bacterium]
MSGVEAILKDSVGVELSEIYNRNHNLWVGISFTNKLFTPDNIVAIIDLALQYTKEKVLVWVPGRMHATNYYYFEKLGRAEALRRAYEDEERVLNFLKQSFHNSKVVLATFDETCTPRFMKRQAVLFKEFSKQGEFYKDTLEIVKQIMLARGRTVEQKRLESLALYVVQELPLLVGGISKNNDPELYTALLYPGMGKLDELAMAISTRNCQWVWS